MTHNLNTTEAGLSPDTYIVSIFICLYQIRRKRGKEEVVRTFFSALCCWNVTQLSQMRLLLQIGLPQPSSRRKTLRL